MAANPKHPQDEPSLRAINFLHKQEIMLVSTALRRLWLIDPESLGFGSHGQDDGPQSPPLKEAFGEVLRQLGEWIADAPEEYRWNDIAWKSSQNEFTLLDSPEASPAELDSCGHDKDPMLTPLRKQVYSTYNMVFSNLYRQLRDEVGPGKIGEFKRPNTSVMVLRVPDNNVYDILHDFAVDTFVYPVWIAPGTTLTLAVDTLETTMTEDGTPWGIALWFRAGQRATMSPRNEAGERSEPGHVVAVLVFGLCEERLVS